MTAGTKQFKVWRIKFAWHAREMVVSLLYRSFSTQRHRGHRGEELPMVGVSV